MRRVEAHCGLRVLSALLALAVSTVVFAAGEVPKPRESWYTLALAGQRCGWMHEVVHVEGERVETTNEMRMTLGRVGAQASLAISWKFVEAPIGKPLVLELTSESSAAITRAKYEFRADGIAVTENTGERTIERVIALPPGEWLTPAQAEARVTAARSSGAREFAYRTIDPGSGLQVIELASTRTAEGPDGGATWRTENKTLGIASVEQVDRAGEVILSQTNLPIGELLAQRSRREEALRPVQGANFDLISASVIQLERPVPKLLTGQRAVVRAWNADGTLLELPTSGAQFVAGLDGGRSEVTVEVGRASNAPQDEIADPRYLASTTIVDASDPAIRALAHRALAQAKVAVEAPAIQRGEALRAFVDRFITVKNLATAFASASTVAQTRAGDCSEHAVLLAALLRSEGIPSRLASGVGYADEFAGKPGVYAWHLWTQALIDGKWIDLDATLRGRAFHPGHILIATSAQDDASVDADFAKLLSTIGNLRVEVISVD